jgi:hypothetical protein
MAKKPGLKAVSTALATMAIILVLILGMSWMAYMVVLNARQQAEMAGRAETVALKAKELIRVYVWLDPARQPDGRYLNLTRISFVGEWSGETVINGLLVVYTDGRTEVRNVNIRLGAGEDKTYLPSELGLIGLDNYNAFRARVKYIQAHTSLGNDFVNVWGRPDKPALYVTGTTRTDTYTTTRTETSRIPTTTTTSVTRTSYTTTVTTTQTVTWTPPPGVPFGKVWCGDAPDLFLRAYVEFNANGWGTPPYQIRVYATYYDWTWNVIRTDEVAVFTVSGTSYSTSFVISHPWGYGGIVMSMRAIDVNGLYAEWGGGSCYIAPPPPPGTASSTSLTTSTGTPTTTTGNTIVTVTETITSTLFVGGEGLPRTTVYFTSTHVSWIGTTVTDTITDIITSVVITTVTYPVTDYVTWWIVGWNVNYGVKYDPEAARSKVCPAGDLRLLQQPHKEVPGFGLRAGMEAAAVAGLLYVGRTARGRRGVLPMLAVSALLLALIGPLNPQNAYGQTIITTTTYVTVWTTVTVSGTYTITETRTIWVTVTSSYTFTDLTRTTVTTTTTWTHSEGSVVKTVTETHYPCYCRAPYQCIWYNCCSGTAPCW